MKEIARKTGHGDPRSALSYHNTQGALGKQLQSDMFGENVPDVPIGVCGKRSFEEKVVESMPSKAVRFNTTTEEINYDSTLNKSEGNGLCNTNPIDSAIVSRGHLGQDECTINKSHQNQAPKLAAGMSLFTGLRNVYSLSVHIYQQKPDNYVNKNLICDDQGIAVLIVTGIHVVDGYLQH